MSFFFFWNNTALIYLYSYSGETSCIASKIDKQLNEYEYRATVKGITGRKVDLIFCTAIDNDVYELFKLNLKQQQD